MFTEKEVIKIKRTIKSLKIYGSALKKQGDNIEIEPYELTCLGNDLLEVFKIIKKRTK